jgi:hypothetical protein
MKTLGSGGAVPPFLTSALDGGEWSASCPGHFTPGKEPQYPLDRRLVGPRERAEKNLLPLLGIKLWPSNLLQVPILTKLSQFPKLHDMNKKNYA